MNFEFLQNINDELFLRECPDLYQLCCASEKNVHPSPTAALSNIRAACERLLKFYYVLNGGQNSKATASSIQKSEIVVSALQNAIEAEIQKREDEINEREKNNKQRTPKTPDAIKMEAYQQHGVLDDKITNIRDDGNEALHSGKLDNVDLIARENLKSLYFVITSILKYCGLINGSDMAQYKEPQKEEINNKLEMETDSPDEYNFENAIAQVMEDGKVRLTFPDSDEYYIGDVVNNRPHGEGRYFYSEDSVYDGEWKNGSPNGYGKRTYENGKIYEGEWKNGKREGKGIYSTFGSETKVRAVVNANWVEDRMDDENGEVIFPDGTKYIGGLKNGYLSGKGRMYREDGSVRFEGQYISGKAVGYTKSYYPNGQINTKGNMQDGKWDGPGKRYYENGQLMYDGEFKDGKWNGPGKKYYESGQLMYDGEYKDDKTNGFGKSYYENGQLKYEGNYRDGKWNGPGKKYYESGQLMYDGEYKENKRDGYGQCYYENGHLIYEGEYKDDKYDGFGKNYFKDGRLLYEGEFKEGKLNGIAKYFGENGQLSYEGEYKDDKRNGAGRSYYESGQLLYEGEWKNGKEDGKGKGYYESGRLKCEGDFKEGKLDGKVLFYYESGQLKYEGEYKNNQWEGIGKQYYENGRLWYEGEYRNHKWEGTGKVYLNTGELNYAGEWKEGKRSGRGIRYTSEGRREGTFEDDVINGYAVLITADLKRHDEYWVNGKKLSLSEIAALDSDDPFVKLSKAENAFEEIKNKKYSFTTKELAAKSCDLICEVLDNNEARDLMSRHKERLYLDLEKCKKAYSDEAVRSGDSSLYLATKKISETIEKLKG